MIKVFKNLECYGTLEIEFQGVDNWGVLAQSKISKNHADFNFLLGSLNLKYEIFK